MFPNKYEKILIFDISDGAIIYNKTTKKSCKLGTIEYSLFKGLDGNKTIEDLVAISGYDDSTLRNLLNLFDSFGLLSSSEIIVSKDVKKKHTLVYGAPFLSIFTTPALKFIFNIVMLLSIPMLISSIIYMKGKIDVDAMIQSANILHVIIMDIILAFSVCLHELSHAISARNNGAFCAEIGYKFDFLVPFAYTTLCGVDEIKSKLKKMQIFFSGIGTNAIIASVSLLLMSTTGLKNSLFLFIVFSCNLCLILINSITFIESDVYHILCYLFNNTRLKEVSLSLFKRNHCRSVGNIIYFLISYIIEPVVIIFLLIIAFSKIGGKLI